MVSIGDSVRWCCLWIWFNGVARRFSLMVSLGDLVQWCCSQIWFNGVARGFGLMVLVADLAQWFPSRIQVVDSPNDQLVSSGQCLQE